MIKLFRKIRQSLLAEGKFTQYLKYAIGEIILVVIGILIALGLNDYYAKVKAEERLADLLKEVRAELAVNVMLAQPLMQFYSDQDSLISMIMSDTLAKEVYETDGNIRYVISSYDKYVVKSSAFDRLMLNSGTIPSKYDTLVDQLKTIYTRDWELVKEYNAEISVDTKDYIDNLKRTKPWYAEYMYSSEISKAATEMMFSDPIYRNHVVNFWMIGVGNHGRLINDMRVDAHAAYRELSLRLGVPDEVTPSLMEPFDLMQFAGIYVSEDDTIKITEEEELMTFQFNDENIEVILPYTDSHFIPGKTFMFSTILKDSEGKINGLNLRMGSYNKTFVKQD